MSSSSTPSTLIPSISTSRLELIAITTETLRSEQASDGQLGNLLRCTVTSEWPHADWEPHVFELLQQRFAADPTDIGWHRYILLRSSPASKPILIGSTGGIRWPSAPQTAEIGYAIVPQFRLRGYAFEATQAIIAWIESTQAVDNLIAHTFPELLGSIRILERCGFTLEGPGEEARTLRYGKQL